MKASFSPDRLNSVSPKLAGEAALGALGGMMRFTPEQQVAGLAVAFAAVLKQYGVHPGKALEVAANLKDRAANITPELRAVQVFVKEEL